MKRYLVRTNCEYAVTVEAESAAEAIEKANEKPYEDWDQSWAPDEAEEQP